MHIKQLESVFKLEISIFTPLVAVTNPVTFIFCDIDDPFESVTVTVVTPPQSVNPAGITHA